MRIPLLFSSLVALTLSACDTGNYGDAPPARVQLNPGTLDLGTARYTSPSRLDSFVIQNIGSDLLFVTANVGDEDGADLVRVHLPPFHTVRPEQSILVEISLDDRTWQWRSGDYDVTVPIDVTYFWSGQRTGEPELPSTRHPPVQRVDRFDLRVVFSLDCDLDGDGYESAFCGGPDCDDRLASVNPSAEEVCNGRDDNCDGAVDGNATDEILWYFDNDGDGWGDDDIVAFACRNRRPGPQWVVQGGDCDDDEYFAHPGMQELCGDCIDNNCDGQIDPGCPNTCP